MEILNIVTIEAGWDAFYIFIGSVMCVIALLLFIYIFTEWYKDKAYRGFLIFLLYPLVASVSLVAQMVKNLPVMQETWV